ncbi:MAG: hypothetical protein WAO12_12825 [Venatoribacter sp.]
MRLVTFDPFRTLNLPNTVYVKPQLLNQNIDILIEADGVIYPEYWQINPLLYGLKKKIFPSPASYYIGHDKVEMTRCFELIAPEHVPFTLIEANTPTNAERVWDALCLPFVAKIPKSSMGNGVFLIENERDWQAYLAQSPVIYAQEYLPIDRDLRIVWVGDSILGGYWRLQAEQGFYNNVAKGGSIEMGIIPPQAAELVEKLARGLGIDHGGFDIAMVGHHPYVFEFNRMFGNQGLQGMQDKINSAVLAHLQTIWGGDTPIKPLTPTVHGGPRLPEAS